MSNLSAKPKSRPRSGERGYEKRDANAKWIFGILAFLLVAGLIMHFCLAGVMGRLERKPLSTDPWTGTRRSAKTAGEAKGVPHLQVVPPEDFKMFRAREETEMNTYGWIDRTAGVVRIPIARAIDLILQRGLPVRPKTNESGLGPSSYELQQQRPLSPQPEIQAEK